MGDIGSVSYVSVYGVGVNRRTESRAGRNEKKKKKRYTKRGKGPKMKQGIP